MGNLIDLIALKKTVITPVVNTREVFEQQLKYPEYDFSNVKGQETI